MKVKPELQRVPALNIKPACSAACWPALDTSALMSLVSADSALLTTTITLDWCATFSVKALPCREG